MVRALTVLRHSLTRKDKARGGTGSHLSSEGVRLARDLGAALPDMDHVTVGAEPRHMETALALGFAVDEQINWPSGYVAGEVEHHDQWLWDQPFVRYADLVTDGTRLAEVVQVHLAHWQRILQTVPDGGSALIVSSGGSIEPVLVAAAPDAPHDTWGSALHQLEGATLEWDGERFTSVALVRRT